MVVALGVLDGAVADERDTLGTTGTTGVSLATLFDEDEDEATAGDDDGAFLGLSTGVVWGSGETEGLTADGLGADPVGEAGASGIRVTSMPKAFAHSAAFRFSGQQ